MLEPGRAGGAESPGVPHLQAVTPAATILPPDQYAPPGSQPLYAISPLTAIAGPASWAVPAGIVSQLNTGSLARITSFNALVLNLLATSVITFALRVNGAAIPGGTRTIPAAPLAVAFFPFDLYYITPQKAVIDILVTVTDAGAYNVQAWYDGYVFGAATMLRYYQALQAVLGY